VQKLLTGICFAGRQASNLLRYSLGYVLFIVALAVYILAIGAWLIFGCLGVGGLIMTAIPFMLNPSGQTVAANYPWIGWTFPLTMVFAYEALRNGLWLGQWIDSWALYFSNGRYREEPWYFCPNIVEMCRLGIKRLPKRTSLSRKA
jgi:hypothetical protein